jgi:hypothetical protein
VSNKELHLPDPALPNPFLASSSKVSLFRKTLVNFRLGDRALLVLLPKLDYAQQ